MRLGKSVNDIKKWCTFIYKRAFAQGLYGNSSRHNMKNNSNKKLITTIINCTELSDHATDI